MGSGINLTALAAAAEKIDQEARAGHLSSMQAAWRDFIVLCAPETIAALVRGMESLRKCAETFEDFEKAFRMLRKDTLAEACAIARADARAALAAFED